MDINEFAVNKAAKGMGRRAKAIIGKNQGRMGESDDSQGEKKGFYPSAVLRIRSLALERVHTT